MLVVGRVGERRPEGRADPLHRRWACLPLARDSLLHGRVIGCPGGADPGVLGGNASNMALM
jgi:hypothetical protein